MHVRRTRITAGFAAAALFIHLCTPAASAWDATGHRVVAYIAWQQMTPEARGRVMEILEYAPVRSDLRSMLPTNGRPLSNRELEYFMHTAVWADMIRDRERAERFERYHRAPWHYTNVFWEHAPGESVTLREDLQPEEQNVLERLQHLESVASDTRYPRAHLAIVVAWLEHLVGDVHQPLHTSARVTESEPEGDRGGNLFSLAGSDNLHWYWDRRLSDAHPRRSDEGDAAYARRLGDMLMEQHPASSLDGSADLNYHDWVDRGFQIASTFVYEGLTRGQEPPASYAAEATRIAEASIALAGYRLGALMNHLFG